MQSDLEFVDPHFPIYSYYEGRGDRAWIRAASYRALQHVSLDSVKRMNELPGKSAESIVNS